MNNLGGPDLLLYLVLAFGGAMFVGNLLALVRPPSKRPPTKKDPRKPVNVSPKATPGSKPNPSTGGKASEGTKTDTPTDNKATDSRAKPGPKRPPQSAPLPVAPKGRTIAMMSVGAIASLWALATLLTK